MRIKFYAPRWGFEYEGWPAFAKRVADAGYDGVEVFPLQAVHEKKFLLQALASHGLELGLIQAELNGMLSFDDYKTALQRNLEILAGYQAYGIKPAFINSQTGREYYSNDQMDECFDICDQFSKHSGISVMHETHRNKWSYAAHVVKRHLERRPGIRLALDISHWFCVSESYLEDQQDAVALAIKHADHIHARVGHTQGPQVTDPRADENSEAVMHHLACWDRWIKVQQAAGKEFCTITPEFGPHPYMAYQCFTTKPVANQWDVNCYMKQLLTDRYVH